MQGGEFLAGFDCMAHALVGHSQAGCIRIHCGSCLIIQQMSTNAILRNACGKTGISSREGNRVPKMLVREYLPGDEQEISRLFSVVFERQLDLGLWNWRFIENPYGVGIIRLMFDKEKLIGHYAVTPVELVVKGEVHKSALSVATMTHPDYWGRGGMKIFTELASGVYSDCEESGIDVVFGFQNENSYDGFTQKLGWHGFGHINGWAIERELEVSSSEQEINFEELQRCDERIDELWVRVRKTDRVMVPRTAEFIDWRYFRKPGSEYTIYGVSDPEGTLQGLLILKIFVCGGEKTGHIIDLIALPRPEIQQASLIKAVEFFADRQIANITCWVSNQDHIGSILDTFGFSQREWPTYFGIKVLDDKFEDAPFVLDADNWSITMGDSDVF